LCLNPRHGAALLDPRRKFLHLSAAEKILRLVWLFQPPQCGMKSHIAVRTRGAKPNGMHGAAADGTGFPRGRHPSANENGTMDRRTILFSQILMTCMMALSMSGIMYFIAAGPNAFSVKAWLTQFVIAWPIAFVLTNVLWPLSMKVARLGLKRSRS